MIKNSVMVVRINMLMAVLRQTQVNIENINLTLYVCNEHISLTYELKFKMSLRSRLSLRRYWQLNPRTGTHKSKSIVNERCVSENGNR